MPQLAGDLERTAHRCPLIELGENRKFARQTTTIGQDFDDARHRRFDVVDPIVTESLQTLWPYPRWRTIEWGRRALLAGVGRVRDFPGESNMRGRRTVLTIEDDGPIRRGIVDALRYAGYDVHEAADAEAGLPMAIQLQLDLLLLDLVLPGASGLEVVRQVREVRPTLPVIVLTARGDEDDRVAGLKLGADDYVVKPFSVKELLARVEAVLRRSPNRPLDLEYVEIPGGTADLARRELRFRDGDRVELSEREADLLRYLASHRNRVVTRDELLAHVWRISPENIATRTIDMHVVRLREKLRDQSAEPRVLLTVRGRGYMFGSEQTDSEVG